MVQEKMPEGVNDNGLTLTGFLFLHALFIEKGRLETTWTVLRKFGYDNEIKLRDDLIPTIKRAPDQVMCCSVLLLFKFYFMLKLVIFICAFFCYVCCLVPMICELLFLHILKLPVRCFFNHSVLYSITIPPSAEIAFLVFYLFFCFLQCLISSLLTLLGYYCSRIALLLGITKAVSLIVDSNSMLVVV